MYKLGNLTIILSSYNCDKNCPFCIAKNNRKFNNKEENLKNLVKQLELFRNNDIRFERVVLSGNGEPSLYDLEELKKHAIIFKDNEDLFDGLRVHTSGNIFFEKEKFELFNELISNVEFDVLRVDIDPMSDMQILGYNRDYMKTESFKRARKIKFDIGLTKLLLNDLFPSKLERMLNDNLNIRIIRFKDLMIGEREESVQAKWIKQNRMRKNEFFNFSKMFLSHFGYTSMNELNLENGSRIIFENSGNYPKDVVYSNGLIMDYSQRNLDIDILRKMALKVDNSKTLNYSDINLK